MAFFIQACTPSPERMKKLLEENPDIVFNAIEKNPGAFFETVSKANRLAQEEGQSGQMERELSRVREELASPADVKIDESRIVGDKSAPVTIVEYMDYNCGYCGRAHSTMKELQEAFPGKIRFVSKHLPILSPTSSTAAEYVEAVGLQDRSKAHKLHSRILENQADFRQGGEEFLKKAAQELGVDMARLERDRKSDRVKKLIEADTKEAREYDFSGTPGFFVNGAAIYGAYPLEFFKTVVEEIIN